MTMIAGVAQVAGVGVLCLARSTLANTAMQSRNLLASNITSLEG